MALMYAGIKNPPLVIDVIGGTRETKLMCGMRVRLPSPFWKIAWYDMKDNKYGCTTVDHAYTGRFHMINCILNVKDTSKSYKCVAERHPLDDAVVAAIGLYLHQSSFYVDYIFALLLIGGVSIFCVCIFMTVLCILYDKTCVCRPRGYVTMKP